VQEALEREKRAAERLRLLDERHRDFTAKVVHDLRTPITIIDGFARTLLEGQVSASQEQRDQYLKLISDASTRLTELVDAVLEVFRLEAEEVSYEIESVDIAASVRQTVNDIDPTGTRISVAGDGEPILAKMDRKLHERILSNLLSNAMKFADAESITEVKVSKSDGFVEVAVTDQGIGIRPEDRHLLFQKFSQISHGTDHSYRGTGLGLYICRTMLEAQGGSIDVVSELGKGSTFTYRLPLADHS
jgi:two-component system sensor histidine kinase ResE